MYGAAEHFGLWQVWFACNLCVPVFVSICGYEVRWWSAWALLGLLAGVQSREEPSAVLKRRQTKPSVRFGSHRLPALVLQTVF